MKGDTTMNSRLNLSFSDELEAKHARDNDIKDTTRHPDDTCSSSSPSQVIEDDDYDSCSSLDGMIPSLSLHYGNNNVSSTKIEGLPISIHYLGREYKADELSHSLQVLQDSTMLSLGGSSCTNRRSSFSSMRKGSSSMSLSHSEHLNSRWAALGAQQEEEVVVLPSSSSRRHCNRNNSSILNQSEHFGSSRRSSTTALEIHRSHHGTPTGNCRSSCSRKYATVLASNTPASTSILSSASEYFGSSSRRNTSLNDGIMSSQSEQFCSTRSRRNSTSDLPTTGKHQMAALRRANTVNTANAYVNSLVGKVSGRHDELKAMGKAKTQRWKEQLDRWGYSNHDVLCVVEDDQVFAKLQRDLRERHAITNGTIQQKIHVFVHNTKAKAAEKEEQQQQQQEQYCKTGPAGTPAGRTSNC